VSTSFIIFLSALTFAGLTAMFFALAMWTRESGCSPSWLVTRAGLPVLSLLAGGAGVVAGSQYKLPRSLMVDTAIIETLSGKWAVFFVICLVLLTVGIVLRARRGQAGTSGGRYGWVLAFSALAALILPLSGVYGFRKADVTATSAIPRIWMNHDAGKQAAKFQKNYRFQEDLDWVSPYIAVWEKALVPYKGQPNLRYLEIGLYQGRSFLWMLENVLTHPSARATGIDPFLRPEFYPNLQMSTLGSKTTIIEGFSQVELRKLPVESFDFIYVDGSHNSRDVLEDVVLCWRLLKDGGLLILDDYRHHAGMKRAIDTFFSFFSGDFEPIHIDYQVLLKKKAIDRRNPDQFR
jgi:SAM-dependent methyltransferase